jgi:hypothetical protein
LRRDIETREATMLVGTRARGEPREVIWLLDVEKRGGQGTELSIRIDSAGDEAVALVEDGGSDDADGSVGGMATEEFLVLTMFMMLDDRG